MYELTGMVTPLRQGSETHKGAQKWRSMRSKFDQTLKYTWNVDYFLFSLSFTKITQKMGVVAKVVVEIVIVVAEKQPMREFSS